MICVIRPSVFANWQLWKLGCYLPTKTERLGPYLSWWWRFKGWQQGLLGLTFLGHGRFPSQRSRERITSFLFFIFILLLFKYSCLHFPPNTLPRPQSSPPTSPDYTPHGFVHVSFRVVPENPSPFPPIISSHLPSGYCQIVLNFNVVRTITSFLRKEKAGSCSQKKKIHLKKVLSSWGKQGGHLGQIWAL